MKEVIGALKVAGPRDRLNFDSA
ncbi:MAG: hypothetical protein HW375_2033, partial [Anaerolineales bacterium]|nr:hypothetical protein [Anaerolineales bacterium]